ncbi:MAG: cysteine desulfurase family protein [Candidatus Saccharimonadales bacterium]
MIYLDYAAATPVSKSVLKSMLPYFSDQFYNPSSLYLASAKLKAQKDDLRSKIASVIGAKPSEIIFTAGGSEANNLAIQGVMNLHSEANLITTNIEHKSVLAPADLFNNNKLEVNTKGHIKLNQLKELIDERTVMVSIILASNEIGVIQKLAKVKTLINQIIADRKLGGNTLPLYLHTDASQAGNYLSLSVDRLGVDLMTINGGKIYGPKQSGLLYVRSGIKLKPLIIGGGQERGMRAGTESLANIAGLAAALEDARVKREHQSKKMKKLQLSLISLLAKDKRIKFNGDFKNRLPNNINLTIPGVDGERLVMELDNLGFMVATGSACNASDDEPSYVLQAIGLSKEDASSSLRITVGRSTTQKNIEDFAKTLLNLIDTNKFIWL